jgi:hypothetical protein
MFLFNSTRRRWLSVLAVTATLTGCAGSGSLTESQAGRITITSKPIGAAVYADGTEIGATPLQIAPASHFRAGFVGFSYRYTGKLALKKAGCEAWSTEVNDLVLSKDVHAKLKCDPNYKAATLQPMGKTPNADATSGDQPGERLQRIESLRKKGLISEDEYKQLRMRVLEKL